MPHTHRALSRHCRRSWPRCLSAPPVCSISEQTPANCRIKPATGSFYPLWAYGPSSFSEKEAKTSACGPGKENDHDMAIYHLEAKVVTRGVGRTACGAAAYMSCSRIYNDYDGIQHDYTRKGGLVWEHVFLPPMAPAAWQDREMLWNAVEEGEKTKDSRLAREFVVALPVELDKRQWIGLVSEFIQDNFV